MEEPRLTHDRNSGKPSPQILPAAFSTTKETVKAIKDSFMGSDEEVMQNENNNGKGEDEAAGRARLKRHREEVAGEVVIPEKWGQEQMMKDWIDYATFDALVAPHRMIVTARDALIADARKARSQRLRIQSSC